MLEKTVSLNELHVNQQKVVDGHKRFSVLSCGRRWGKSALAINLSVSYFGIQTMLTVGLVCLVAFMIHMVYTMNLKELESKEMTDKKG
jgi:hypothetical protein